jgi:hypothetical protein
MEEMRLQVTLEDTIANCGCLTEPIEGILVHFVQNMDEMGHQADRQERGCELLSETHICLPVPRSGRMITLFG